MARLSVVVPHHTTLTLILHRLVTLGPRILLNTTSVRLAFLNLRSFDLVPHGFLIFLTHLTLMSRRLHPLRVIVLDPSCPPPSWPSLFRRGVRRTVFRRGAYVLGRAPAVVFPPLRSLWCFAFVACGRWLFAAGICLVCSPRGLGPLWCSPACPACGVLLVSLVEVCG